MPAIQSDRPEDTYAAREERLSPEEPRPPAPEDTPELDRETILGADDLPIMRVEIPEWKGHGHVGTMSGVERDQWDLFLYHQRGPDRELNFRNLRAALVAMTQCRASGERLWTLEDVEALGRKNGKALDRLYEAARKLNRLSEEDIEELTKNSPGGQSGSPRSDSAATSESSTPTSSIES